MKEEAEVFTEELKEELRQMMKIGVENEINWGKYVIGDKIQGINSNLIESYIKYLGNRRLKEIGLSPLEIENEKEVLFHLEGENIFVPKEEKNCYVLTTFSNDKLISILCSYNRFKWRYELSNLIDSKRVMEILI